MFGVRGQQSVSECFTHSLHPVCHRHRVTDTARSLVCVCGVRDRCGRVRGACVVVRNVVRRPKFRVRELFSVFPIHMERKVR